MITGNNTNLDRGRITLKDDDEHVKDAILVIDHFELTDQTWYNCTAKNEATEFGRYEEGRKTTYVQVKLPIGKLFVAMFQNLYRSIHNFSMKCYNFFHA